MSSHREYAALVERVQACRRCATMESRTRVLSAANGLLTARVLFVAEAPGRLGADRTGIPLSMDRTAVHFDALLGCAGLSRADAFVTNAVLCNPRDKDGRNRPPRGAERANCRDHLRASLDIVRAPYVVTLGTVALAELDAIERHGLVLRDAVGLAVSWRGRTLIPLYHPGPRARVHRPWASQREDFVRLGSTIRSGQVVFSAS